MSNKQIKNVLQKTVNAMGKGWRSKLPECRIAYPASPPGVCPVVDLYVKGAFRSQELDGCEMMLGFRQVWGARERNTLRPVLCIELDDERFRWGQRSMDGSPHGAFIGQVPWVTSKGRYLLGLLHGIRSV